MIPALISSYPHNTTTSSFLRNSSSMYHAGMSRSRAKKTSDPVSDPLVDRSTEYKNTPEHSADTSTENSQTSAPLTESGDAGEVQSTQPVGKGGS
jgi:condensin complex subunit 1